MGSELSSFSSFQGSRSIQGFRGIGSGSMRSWAEGNLSVVLMNFGWNPHCLLLKDKCFC